MVPAGPCGSTFFFLHLSQTISFPPSQKPIKFNRGGGLFFSFSLSSRNENKGNALIVGSTHCCGPRVLCGFLLRHQSPFSSCFSFLVRQFLCSTGDLFLQSFGFASVGFQPVDQGRAFAAVHTLPSYTLCSSLVKQCFAVVQAARLCRHPSKTKTQP